MDLSLLLSENIHSIKRHKARTILTGIECKDKIFYNKRFQFQTNDRVIVTDGPFKGFTGHVVRLKGLTRVGVNIDKVGFVCTNYIPKSFLKVVK